MPIDSEHPQYQARKKEWGMCRKVYNADVAQFVSSLSGDDARLQEAYVRRACFFNFMKPTVAGIVGSLTNKPAAIDAPESLKAWAEDVGGDATSYDRPRKSIEVFLLNAYTEVLIVGGGGILISGPQERRPNDPLHLVLVQRENVTNWGKDFVVIKEMVEEAAAEDKYNIDFVMQYRELYLQNKNGRQACWTRIWRENKDGDDPWVSMSDEPLQDINGNVLDFIPFVSFGPEGLTPVSPPLMELVRTAVSHLNNSADREHAAHYGAMPTFWRKCFGEPGENSDLMRVGPTACWESDDPNADAGVIQVDGDLEPQRALMQDKEELMRVHGARLLESARLSGGETAESVRTRHSYATAPLASIVAAMENAFQRTLENVIRWDSLGEPGSVRVRLNRQYTNFSLPYTVAELVTLVSANLISATAARRTLLERGVLHEGYDPDLDIDQIEEDLDREMHSMMLSGEMSGEIDDREPQS